MLNPTIIAEDLISLVAQGDEHAFALLFNRCRSKVYSIALYLTKSPALAEDICQEVFVSLWVSRRHLPNVKSFNSYLYTIIYHKVLNYLKKEDHQQQIVLWSVRHKPAAVNNTEEAVHNKQIYELLDRAIEQLPAQKKLIYRLNKEGGMNYQEIAERLGISSHTVKNHLIAAGKFLRNYMRQLPLPGFIWTLLDTLI